MYRDQNSPGGVVETETGVAGGSDWGPGDDVTVAVEGGERWRKIVDAGRKRGRNGENNMCMYMYIKSIYIHSMYRTHPHLVIHSVNHQTFDPATRGIRQRAPL